jgi:thiamine-monophosphate kinase
MPKTISEIGEFKLIDLLDELIQKEGHADSRVVLGIGDDAACFSARPGFEILVTCDSLVEGRHYLPGHLSARDLGRRAMTVNLSDIGAMGGLPLYAFISLGLKADTLIEDLKEMYRGFISELNPFGAAILGGNLTRVLESNFIDITLVGEVEKNLMIKRSGAKAGDKILVTGFPGQSFASLQVLLKASQQDVHNPLAQAYCRPIHRAREGRVLAQTGLITAMIDTSDGLLGDLGHICEKSRLGALLVQEQLPLNDLLTEAAAYLQIKPYELVLQPSDDYELILTCPADAVAQVQSALRSASDLNLVEIGVITDPEEGIFLLRPDGRREPLKPLGWDHFQ